MQYDPIKKDLGNIFNKSVFRRKLFYRLLDILLLRTWHVHKAIRQWEKSSNHKKNILDAGSGFGQYIYYLARKNKKWQILGVDVKEDQIEDCRQFFKKANFSNVNFQTADLTRFTSSPLFDLVLAVDVMEHIEEDITVFENLHHSMNPGAMLLISTPSDQGGSDVHKHEPGQVKSFIGEHVRDGYNIKEIQQKLRKAGFSDTSAHYSYGWPGKISWKLSMKFPILLVNYSKTFFLVLPFYYLLTFWFVLIMNFLDVSLNHRTGTGLIVKAWK
ncbi:MAG TPA: class I SAM-dependent methyltransferase [Bacteroidales bacterium]|nr:class I SAM-dependent methyltransferase [Bacteroidales bacterium]HPR57085.1 class I SAM-dependent methyltransferase [Bacteroidales bacterium]HRW97003.1 class I SAM-dependent methyltransferase [Bacteroidales bacterium]